uniref:Uncharacterized protein n=1 Tax=Anguilla anguilla TaxID=7936 RepID=A0A0E9SZU3_ANGAN
MLYRRNLQGHDVAVMCSLKSSRSSRTSLRLFAG